MTLSSTQPDIPETERNRHGQYRIVYFQQNPVWGACEEYLVMLIEGVDRKRYHPLLLCPQCKELAPVIKAVRCPANVWHFQNERLSVIRLASKFRELQPDLIHFNDPCIKGVVAARLAGLRYLVMTYHTPELRIQFNWKGRLLWRLAFQAPIRLIALSDRNRQILIDDYGFRPEQITVIPHGLKREKFEGPFDREQVRRELGIPLDSPVLINVARLAAQKGHGVLIEAVARLPALVRDRLRVVLVGEGENRPLIEAMITQRGLQDIFVLTGYRTDVPRLLAASDLFVLSSHFEGLPFAVLETMAMAKPVIATDVGGVAEAVVHDETGLIIRPRNPQKLAEAISQLLRDSSLTHRMGRQGRKRFEALFTQERMVERTQAFYEEILNSAIKK